jgi:DNA mismatch repair protein MutS2
VRPRPDDQDRPAQLRAAPLRTGRLKLGERVTLRTLGAEGIITALGENDAEVQVGPLRVRAKLGDILRKAGEVESEKAESGRADKKKRAGAPDQVSTLTISSPSPGMELDLRGQSAEDALATLDDYLDRAYLAGMPFVRIIHGKGTGKLRQEVRAALRGHPHVSAWVTGQEGEGGDGVTVAKIVSG